MGQAKKRREQIAQYAEGRCNGCNLCCVAFTIPEISKPAFTPCPNICAAGCSLHNSDSKPKTCIDFNCDYIVAHALNSPSKALIPHPKDAGAYVSHPGGGSNTAVMHVDPRNPGKWRTSGMPAYLKALVRTGLKIAIMDRGFQFETATVAGIDSLAAMDHVEQAIANGHKPTLLPEAS